MIRIVSKNHNESDHNRAQEGAGDSDYRLHQVAFCVWKFILTHPGSLDFFSPPGNGKFPSVLPGIPVQSARSSLSLRYGAIWFPNAFKAMDPGE